MTRQSSLCRRSNSRMASRPVPTASTSKPMLRKSNSVTIRTRSSSSTKSTKPLPVHGTWKTLIRLQRDNYVAGLPVYLPEDSAIPAPAVRGNVFAILVEETEFKCRLSLTVKHGNHAIWQTRHALHVAEFVIGVAYLNADPERHCIAH